MIRNLSNEEKISYILIGMGLGIMIGYFIGLITPDLELMLYGF